jgi:hypothetical protein
VLEGERNPSLSSRRLLDMTVSERFPFVGWIREKVSASLLPVSRRVSTTGRPSIGVRILLEGIKSSESNK